MSKVFWVVNSQTLLLKAMWHSFTSTKLPHIPLSLSLMWFRSSTVKTNSMADACLTFYRNSCFLIKGVPLGAKMFHFCFLKWRACNSGCVEGSFWGRTWIARNSLLRGCFYFFWGNLGHMWSGLVSLLLEKIHSSSMWSSAGAYNQQLKSKCQPQDNLVQQTNLCQ